VFGLLYSKSVSWVTNLDLPRAIWARCWSGANKDRIKSPEPSQPKNKGVWLRNVEWECEQEETFSLSFLQARQSPVGSVEKPITPPPEYWVGTNECMWCRSPAHLIAVCPRRLKAIDKSAAKPLASPHQGALPPRPAIVGQAYVMSKKEVATSYTVVT